MPQHPDLKTVRFYLENAREHVRNVVSKKGTNGKDGVLQGIQEALTELKKFDSEPTTQPAGVAAG